LVSLLLFRGVECLQLLLLLQRLLLLLLQRLLLLVVLEW
jgi:hypothetical protein